MAEQTGRDAAVAVITEAFNTGHDAPPEHALQLEKHRRHDAHEHHYACWLCMNLAGLLAGHIADSLAEAGLLRTALEPMVTRTQVRTAATALFEWNNELAGEPRFTLHHVTGGVDREPYGALVDEVLHHLGITVQEGQQHA